LIADRDIQAVKTDTLTHPDEWTRKLNPRNILLTIHEWDADKVCGRELMNAMDLRQRGMTEPSLDKVGRHIGLEGIHAEGMAQAFWYSGGGPP
jgi:hypothetical protein